MKVSRFLVSFLVVLFFFGKLGIIHSEDAPEDPGKIDESKASEGDKGYLQWTLHVVEDRNRKGQTILKASYTGWIAPKENWWPLPVNTQVQVKIQSRSLAPIVIIVPEKNQTIYMEYNPKNMMPIEEYIKLLVKPTPVDINSYTFKNEILKGKIVEGMSKEEVKLAWGIPTKNRTPSLEQDQWVYWADRWRSLIVSFTDGKVSNVNPPYHH